MEGATLIAPCRVSTRLANPPTIRFSESGVHMGGLRVRVPQLLVSFPYLRLVLLTLVFFSLFDFPPFALLPTLSCQAKYSPFLFPNTGNELFPPRGTLANRRRHRRAAEGYFFPDPFPYSLQCVV
jgi:hypothetical protein